jgi:hypothetical protein
MISQRNIGPCIFGAVIGVLLLLVIGTCTGPAESTRKLAEPDPHRSIDVIFTTSPLNADVYVDGVCRKTFLLNPQGRYQVRIEARGYETVVMPNFQPHAEPAKSLYSEPRYFQHVHVNLEKRATGHIPHSEKSDDPPNVGDNGPERNRSDSP